MGYGVVASPLCHDEWDRWQQGGCLEYAVALISIRPELRFGTVYRRDGEYDIPLHHFAHDDRHAYDLAGRHRLPYVGLPGSGGTHAGLDEDPDWYDKPDPDELPAARAHALRNAILSPP